MHEEESPLGEDISGSKLIGSPIEIVDPPQTPKPKRKRSLIPQRIATAIVSAGAMLATMHGQATHAEASSFKPNTTETSPYAASFMFEDQQSEQRRDNPSLLFDRNLTPDERLIFQPYLDITLGQTTEDQISQLPIKQKNDLGNGYTEYVFDNPNLSWYNTAVTKDGIVTFKRIVPILGQGKAVETPAVSNYTKNFGAPKQTLQGSKVFGTNASIWEYNGFSVIGNNRTNEVYAIDYFGGPDYLQEIGNDFQANPQSAPRI